jgi:hypothetical protein
MLQSLQLSCSLAQRSARQNAPRCTYLLDDSSVLAVAYDGGDLFASLLVVAVALIWQLFVSSLASVVQHNFVPSRVQLLLQV